MTRRDVWQTHVERLMCEAMPHAGQLGVAERHLQQEIANRVDFTSNYLSRRRSLANPYLNHDAHAKRGNKLVEVVRDDIVKKRGVLGISEEEILQRRHEEHKVHDELRNRAKIEKMNKRLRGLYTTESQGKNSGDIDARHDALTMASASAKSDTRTARNLARCSAGPDLRQQAAQSRRRPRYREDYVYDMSYDDAAVQERGPTAASDAKYRRRDS